MVEYWWTKHDVTKVCRIIPVLVVGVVLFVDIGVSLHFRELHYDTSHDITTIVSENRSRFFIISYTLLYISYVETEGSDG